MSREENRRMCDKVVIIEVDGEKHCIVPIGYRWHVQGLHCDGCPYEIQ